MQAMQAVMAVHKQTEQKGQPATGIEKGVFSEQLTQSIAQNAQQTEDSSMDKETSEQPLDADGWNQESEQIDATEDQVAPDAAFLFQQPFLTAEHQLAMNFRQLPVMDDAELAKGKTGMDSLQVQPTISNLAELPRQTEVAVEPLLNPEASAAESQGLPILMDGEYGTLEAEAKKLLPETQQKLNQVDGKVVSDQDKPATTLEKRILNDGVQEVPTTKEKTLVDQQKVPVNSDQSAGIANSLIAEKTVELKQLQAVEEKQVGINDLDMQSDLRLKVTAAKTSETPIAQQPVVQREVQMPLALTSESQTVNQQVLTQAVSEVVIDQVTTLKDGQQTTARLSLTPETLGHIKIELKMSDNQLQTTIVVESMDTKEFLDKGMQQLTTSLAQKNIQMQDVSIQLSMPQEASFAFSESNSQHHSRQESEAVTYFDPVEELNQPVGTEEETSSAGRLSILA